MVSVPLLLEGHQGAVGLCTGKPILDVFLTDNSRVYSPPSVPPMMLSEPISADAAGEMRLKHLTTGYNYLSNLQKTTVFIEGPAEKKVSIAASYRSQQTLNRDVSGICVRRLDPQILFQTPRAAGDRQVAQSNPFRDNQH